MSNIHLVKTQRTAAQASVVEVLRRFLARAEQGELDGVALVGTTAAGETVTTWSENLNKHLLISGLEIVKHRMITQTEGQLD